MADLEMDGRRPSYRYGAPPRNPPPPYPPKPEDEMTADMTEKDKDDIALRVVLYQLYAFVLFPLFCLLVAVALGWRLP